MKYAVLAVVAALIVIFVVWLARRGRPPVPAEVEVRDVPTVPQADAPPPVEIPQGTVDLDGLLQSMGWPDPMTGSEPVVVDLEDGTALVLGDRKQALAVGEVIGEAGPKLVSASRRVSIATQAGIEAAKQSGHLVLLHPDSAAALNTLKADQAKDAAGFVYSTLRGSDGKYRHVVKLKDVGKLQTLSSGAAIISALAMQAQLDRIEKRLGEIQSGITGIQGTLANKAWAERAALDDLFSEIYATAHATGQLTPAQWSQIAPKISDTYRLRKETAKELEGLIAKLSNLPSGAKDRAVQLQGVAHEILDLLDRLDRDDRRVGQAQALRLWHLATAQDPSLNATLINTHEQVDQRLAERARLLKAVETAVGDQDVRGLLQRRHRGTRSQIREQAFSLSNAAHIRRLALPERLAISATSAQSADDVGVEYTLTPDEAVLLAISQCWLMGHCASSEADLADLSAFRAQTIDAITSSDPNALTGDAAALADRLRAQLSDEQARTLSGLAPIWQARDCLQSRVRSLLLLVELYSFHPWTPTDPDRPAKTARKWNEKKRATGLQELVTAYPYTEPGDAERIKVAAEETNSTLFGGSPNYYLMGLLMVGGLGAGILTAGIAAPAIGTFVGTTMFGLYGAAATSAGLAALGGGSLAAGGLGMAGGTAVITAAGGLLGLGLSGATAAATTHSSSDDSRRVLGRLVAEVAKLHLLCKVLLIDELGDLAALDAVIAGLRERRDELGIEKENRAQSAADSTEPEPAADAQSTADTPDTAKEEADQLKAAERVLTRAVEDLLRHRGELLRKPATQN